MPIRMERDPEKKGNKQNNDNQQSGSSGGGGLGILMNFLPLLLPIILKNKKLTFLLAIGGAIWYFWPSGSSNSGDFVDNNEGFNTENFEDFSFGATFDEKKYDEAEVFEPLAVSYGNNNLPTSISLLKYAPKRLHQGRQGSCVGWASSYAARTILHAQASGQNPNSAPFSPAFLYNQIALPNCQGAYMKDAMQILHRVGTLPERHFSYDENSCRLEPDPKELREAGKYKIKGYNRLTMGHNNYKPDLTGIRQNLAQGAPVVIGMSVGGTFMHQMRGKEVWKPNQRDYSQKGFSGHAMSVIGYDDNKYGGAFQIMNSWGQDWGRNGVTWISYRDFEHFTKEAYGLYPEGNAKKFDKNKLGVKFGLIDNSTNQLIPLREVANQVFRNRSPLKIDSKFKVAVTNTVECYIYVFGEETDGSSYVLFPYTEKHSAYCGITGTRVFPKDYSMVADNLGSRDRIAVVVSKTALNYNAVNNLINSSRQRTYEGKIHDAIASEEVKNVKFESKDAIEFICDLNGKNAVGVVIEIDKK